MATDTDATAARLRDELWHIAMNLNPTATVSPAWNHRLDTLIQYHRAAGAVEALDQLLQDYRARHWYLPNVITQALAAAQARLAAYEEDR